MLHEMNEATIAYEEKARDQWVLDFPAQVALCATQIWWAVEVNISFGRLEEGYENALKDYLKKQVRLFFYNDGEFTRKKGKKSYYTIYSVFIYIQSNNSNKFILAL